MQSGGKLRCRCESRAETPPSAALALKAMSVTGNKDTASPRPVPPRWRWCKRAALAVFVVAAVAVVLFCDVPTLESLRSFSQRFGAAAPVAFFLLYVLATQFPIPRTIFTITAGVLFGPVLGVTVALLATTSAAAVSITLLRSLLDAHPDNPARAADQPTWINRLYAYNQRHPALTHITDRLRERGWVAVFFLRLIAGIPFSVLNYACVLTPIRRRDFVVATFFGSAPSTIAGVLLGEALAGSHDTRMMWVLGGLLIIGLVGLIVDSLLPVKSKA